MGKFTKNNFLNTFNKIKEFFGHVNQDLIKIPIKKQKPKSASAFQTILKSVSILFKHFLDFCLIIRFS